MLHSAETDVGFRVEDLAFEWETNLVEIPTAFSVNQADQALDYLMYTHVTNVKVPVNSTLREKCRVTIFIFVSNLID